MILLNDLPVEHPYRNTPLANCFYKRRGATLWKPVFPSYKISKKTFNELGEAWTNSEVFCWNPYENN